MNNFLKKIITNERILIGQLTIMHVFSLLLFHDCYKSFIFSMALIFIYFYLSRRKNKMALALTMINFMIFGVLIESLIIFKTNALKYQNTFSGTNIPLWLIPSYFFFVLGTLNFYDIFLNIKLL